MSCERKSRWISAPHLAALVAAVSLWLVSAAPAGAQSPAVESSGAHPTSPESEQPGDQHGDASQDKEA